jgi:hypothetical protein
VLVVVVIANVTESRFTIPLGWFLLCMAYLAAQLSEMRTGESDDRVPNGIDARTGSR